MDAAAPGALPEDVLPSLQALLDAAAGGTAAGGVGFSDPTGQMAAEGRLVWHPTLLPGTAVSSAAKSGEARAFRVLFPAGRYAHEHDDTLAALPAVERGLLEATLQAYFPASRPPRYYMLCEDEEMGYTPAGDVDGDLHTRARHEGWEVRCLYQPGPPGAGVASVVGWGAFGAQEEAVYAWTQVHKKCAAVQLYRNWNEGETTLTAEEAAPVAPAAPAASPAPSAAFVAQARKALDSLG